MSSRNSNLPPDKYENQSAKRFRTNTPQKDQLKGKATTTQSDNLAEICLELVKCNRQLIRRTEQLIELLIENGLVPPDNDEDPKSVPVSYATVTKQPNIVRRSEVRKRNNNAIAGQPNNNRNAVIPPIIVEDMENRQQIWNAVLNITDKVSFCPINSKRYRICVNDNLENYTKVLQYVKGVGLKGNTYTPKDAKPISLLVRNLEYVDALDEEAIKAEYRKSGCEVIKAVKWSTKAMASKNKFFWLVQFQSKTDMAKLNEKNLILNVVVRYEKPLSRLEIMQCRNCKRFEHAKSSCFNDFRCIKCPTKHEPGKCELPDASKPYCCNCEKDGHPANSPNCPVYIGLLNRRKIGTGRQPSYRQLSSNDSFSLIGRKGKIVKATTSESVPESASEIVTEQTIQQTNVPKQSASGTIKKVRPNESNVKTKPDQHANTNEIQPNRNWQRTNRYENANTNEEDEGVSSEQLDELNRKADLCFVMLKKFKEDIDNGTFKKP